MSDPFWRRQVRTDADRVRLGRTFDDIAELYDRTRPGYPDELIEDVITLSGIPEGGRILEIGCGTGKASLPFARRGYRMVCAEPGAALGEVAGRHLASYEGVEIVTSRFEDLSFEPASFDLVMAATSFWWVDPAVRVQRSARALRPGGCLAVFRNAHVSGGPGDDGFFEAVQDVYREHAPEIADPEPLPDPSVVPPLDDELVRDGWFEAIAVRVYPWTEVYATDRYLDLCRTFSPKLALPEERREGLLDAMGRFIDQRYGGRVTKHHAAVLQLVRKVQDARS